MGTTMGDKSELLAVIQSIHAAGLDPALWPRALADVARLMGGQGATLESYAQRKLREFHVTGIPPAEQLDYVEHFSAINPRAAYCLRYPEDPLHWDYKILDEQAMNRDAFYSEFLQRTGFRYFIAGQWYPAPQEITVMSVQRARKKGHVDKSEITVMARLLPHVRMSVDTAMRLRAANGTSSAFRDALDWLGDGVLLVRADGSFIYANAAMQAIARRNDGIRLTKNRVEFRTPPVRERFEKALAMLARLRASDLSVAGPVDFPVPRRPEQTPYLVSLRPLPHSRVNCEPTQAVAIVFVRDAQSRGANALLLREVFGLTDAETGVAQALQAGTPLGAYARERAVSLNTVYTHLRRIKEKTGCRRLPELIRRLNDLQLPLRELRIPPHRE